MAVLDGSASITATATVTGSAHAVRNASAAITAAATVTGSAHVVRNAAAAITATATVTGSGRVIVASEVVGDCDIGLSAFGELSINVTPVTPPSSVVTRTVTKLQNAMQAPGILKGVPYTPNALFSASLGVTVTATAFDEGSLDTIIDPTNPPGSSTPVLYWRASDAAGSAGAEVTTLSDQIATTAVTGSAGSSPRKVTEQRKFGDGSTISYTALQFRSWRADQLAAAVGAYAVPVTIMWVGRGTFDASQGATDIQYLDGDAFASVEQPGEFGTGEVSFGDGTDTGTTIYQHTTAHLKVYTLILNTTSDLMELRQQTGRTDQGAVATGLGGSLASLIMGGRDNDTKRSSMILTELMVFNEEVDTVTQEAMVDYWLTKYKINRV